MDETRDVDTGLDVLNLYLDTGSASESLHCSHSASSCEKTTGRCDRIRRIALSETVLESTSKLEDLIPQKGCRNDSDIDFRSFAMCLPPIPYIPTCRDTTIATPSAPPPTPTSATISLESLPPIPLPRTLSALIPNEGLSLPGTHKPKSLCQHDGCKWYGDEFYGGYCSSCFGCHTIPENSPPDGPSNITSQLRYQLCVGNGCEFFGAREFSGYCSKCHGKQTRLSEEKTDSITDWCSDDMKMCIICLHHPYNTVLLPCGHLYLCYQCASSIKNSNGTCPACRTTIRSFHRVFTPD